MSSFYGGQQGKNFEIKKIFRSVYYNTTDLRESSLKGDLEKRWHSSISVGEFVLVSYGLQGDEEYNKYKEIDKSISGKIYNSTLWQKIYIEEYEKVEEGIETIFLTGQKYGLGYRLLTSSMGLSPNISVDRDTGILDVNQNPYVTINNTDPDNPILKFFLPRAQDIQQGNTTILNPVDMPSFSLDKNNINEPVLNFKLPSAAQFYYGDKLGQSKDGTYVIEDSTFSNFRIGDYYINEPYGFIYKVIEKTGNSVTFKYQATIMAPVPEVQVTNLSPYTEGEKTSIEIESSFENPDEKTGWKLNFKIPQIPTFTTGYKPLGSIEQGSVESDIVDENTLKFIFNIPQGSRFFIGSEVNEENSTSVIIEDSKLGDYYLNTDTGFIYKQDVLKNWTKQEGSLKGPTGDSLNIIASYIITSEQVPQDTLENVSQYIQQQLGRTPQADELIAVSYLNNDQNSEIAYWYYYVSNKWGRLLLSGGISSLLLDQYDINNSINKAYTTKYINTLIKSDNGFNDKDKQTYSASKIDDMLSWGSFSDIT